MRKYKFLVLILFFVGMALSGCIAQEEAQIPEESAIDSIAYNADLSHSTITLHVGEDGPVKYIVAKNTSILNAKKIDSFANPDFYFVSQFYNPGEFHNFSSFELMSNLADDVSSPVLVLVDKEGNILDWLTVYTSRTRYNDHFMTSVFHERSDVKETGIVDVFYNVNEGRIAFDIEVAEKDVPAVVRMSDTGTDKELICEFLIQNPGKHRVLFIGMKAIHDINASVIGPSDKVLAFSTTQGNHSSMFGRAHYLVRQNVSVVTILAEKPVVVRAYDLEGNEFMTSQEFYPGKSFTWVIPVNASDIQSVNLTEGNKTVAYLTNESFTMRYTSFPMDFYLQTGENQSVSESVYTIPAGYTDPEVIEFTSLGESPAFRNVMPGQTYIYSVCENMTYGDHIGVIIMEKGEAKNAVKATICSTEWGPKFLTEDVSKAEIDFIRNRAIKAVIIKSMRMQQTIKL